MTNFSRAVSNLLLLLATSSKLVPSVLGQTNAQPAHTHFIPLPEPLTNTNTISEIKSNSGDIIVGIIAFAISTDDTIVWYDHWEDGYESVINNPAGTTEVWGDGDCSNGSAPGTTCSADTDDRLVAGQSIVITNNVNTAVSSTATTTLYDGRDKVVSSFPIAITRGMYPEARGTLFSGAVEVASTKAWGTHFVAPVAQTMPEQALTGDAFQHTGMYVMAKEDGTEVSFKDENDVEIITHTLAEGESVMQVVDAMGYSVTTSKKVQCHLLTGDIGANYEMRWFSLLPFDKWEKDYVSPTGDSYGHNKILMYNPNAYDITVTYQVIKSPEDNTSPDHGESWYRTRTVGANNWKYTDTIDYGTGARLISDDVFYPLSITDTPPQSTKLFDWGFPLMPYSKLSPQVLVGWGWGCTNNFCGGSGVVRSVVYVTAVEDATIFVDVDNDGVPEATMTKNALALQSYRFEDSSDLDMSGAIIWAVTPGQPHDSSDTVNIAASWGQDSCKSQSNDVHAMDLGTLIVPMDVIQVNEIATKVGGGCLTPNVMADITVNVQNVGMANLEDVRIVRSNLDLVTCTIEYNGSTENCADSDKLDASTNDAFVVDLIRRGGSVTIQYQQTIGADYSGNGNCIEILTDDVDILLDTDDETVIISEELAYTALPTLQPSSSPTQDTPSPVAANTPQITPPPNFVGECVDQRRGLSALEEKWNISGFEFAYDWNHFEFDFEVNAQINDLDQIRGVIFHDDCVTPYNGTSLTVNKRNFYGAGGLGKHNIPINVTVDSTTIAQDELYNEDTDGSQVVAGIEFCLRYSLYTPPDVGETWGIEVNFLEIITRLSIDLSDGFALDEFNVAPKNICEEQAEDAFGIEAYFCETGNEADDTYSPLALNQGEMVNICVRPDAEARSLGLRMRRLRNATFTMGDLSQRAILDISRPAANGLTSISCVPGSGVCHFQTLLFAPFFAAPGFVNCAGAADLQFGGDSNPLSVSGPGLVRRALRGEEGDDGRELQDDNDVPSAAFDVGSMVNQGSQYGTSAAPTTMRSSWYLLCVIATAMVGVLSFM